MPEGICHFQLRACDGFLERSIVGSIDAIKNFVRSPSSLWSGEAPALLDVSSIAGVDATSVVQVGAWFVPAAIYTSTWLWSSPSPRP